MNNPLTKKDRTDRLVKLLFFDPRESRDGYIALYKNFEWERFSKEGGYRYSPIFLLAQDARFCAGLDSSFGKNKRAFHFPFFASVILVELIFSVLGEHLLVLPQSNDGRRKKINNFRLKLLRKYEPTLKPLQVEALRDLRNSLEHSNYSLRYKHPKATLAHHFSLSASGSTKLITLQKSVRGKAKYWQVDVVRYVILITDIINDLDEDLLDQKQLVTRNRLLRKTEVDSWVMVKDVRHPA